MKTDSSPPPLGKAWEEFKILNMHRLEDAMTTNHGWPTNVKVDATCDEYILIYGLTNEQAEVCRKALMGDASNRKTEGVADTANVTASPASDDKEIPK